MEMILKPFLWVATHFGWYVPDVVNHDMSSESSEDKAERKARFSWFTKKEEEIKKEAEYRKVLDTGLFDDDEEESY